MILQIRLNVQAECCCSGKTGNTSPFECECIKTRKRYISSISPELPEQSNSLLFPGKAAEWFSILIKQMSPEILPVHPHDNSTGEENMVL